MLMVPHLESLGFRGRARLRGLDVFGSWSSQPDPRVWTRNVPIVLQSVTACCHHVCLHIALAVVHSRRCTANLGPSQCFDKTAWNIPDGRNCSSMLNEM